MPGWAPLLLDLGQDQDRRLLQLGGILEGARVNCLVGAGGSSLWKALRVLWRKEEAREPREDRGCCISGCHSGC